MTPERLQYEEEKKARVLGKLCKKYEKIKEYQEEQGMNTSHTERIINNLTNA